MSKSHIALIIAVFFFFTALSFYFSRTYGLPQFQSSSAVMPTVVPTATMFRTPSPTATPSPTLTPTPIPTAVPTRVPVKAPAADGQVRLMPLGDSITAGGIVFGAYRTTLWKRLVKENGYKIDFVGTMHSGTLELGDLDHEGHPGYTISQLSAGVSGWVSTYQPDIILLHIGTNDILANTPASTMTSELSALIGKIFAAKPNTYLVVSSLIVMPNANQSIWSEYNASIPGVVAQYSGQGRKIVFMNMANVLTASDLLDGVHPNYSGYNMMGYTWAPVASIIYKEYLP